MIFHALAFARSRREVLKTEGEARGSQPPPSDLAKVNEWLKSCLIAIIA